MLTRFTAALVAACALMGQAQADPKYTADQIAAIRILAAVDDASVLCPGFGGVPHSKNVHEFLARHGLTQEVLVATGIEEKLDTQNFEAAKADPAGFCARFVAMLAQPEVQALAGP